MKIFLDFDDFFLKTEDILVADFFQLLTVVTGATNEEVLQTYKQFSGARFVKGLPYSLERHIDFLSELRSFDVKSAKEKARAFFVDLKEYVFDGSEKFLQGLSKKDMYLLTYGEKGFQDLKISGSGLRKFFHKVVVTQGDKSEEIERVAQSEGFSPDETIVFGDNRCGHFAGAKERGIITIHLKRLTDKYSKEPCGECQYTVENFAELKDVIDTLY